MLKRGFDIVVASVGLLVSAPVLVVAAVAIKLTSGGPVLYRAPRAGLGGRKLDVLKLRTMPVGVDQREQRVTAAHDERVTPVGQVLRRFKLDEIPQFWNVLAGEMSVVGPRPEDWDIVQTHFTPRWQRTLSVRPGIASSADVCWYPDLNYHDPPPRGVPVQEYYVTHHMPAQLEESLRYIEHQSFFVDIKLVLQMAYCVLVRSWIPPPKRPPNYDELSLLSVETVS